MNEEYARQLSSLQRRRDALEAELVGVNKAIEGLRIASGLPPQQDAAPPTAAAPAAAKRRGKQSAFIPAVLSILGSAPNAKLLTTQEIVDALLASGYETDAKDFYRNAATMLKREAARPDGRITSMVDRWCVRQV